MFNSYHTFLLIIIMVCLYWISHILANAKVIGLALHKKIWNYLLALDFLITGLLGIILAVSIDQKLLISGYQIFLWYHVEFGIAMTIVAIFHLSWHLRYYLPQKQ